MPTAQFVSCSVTATTVGATLRANSVYYADLDAVYVLYTRLDELVVPDTTSHQLLAISSTNANTILRGAAIIELTSDPQFRREFRVFRPATSATQPLEYGESVLLDVENLTPPVAAGRRVAILALYPAPGRVDRDVKPHYGVCISDSGAHVWDVGYRDRDDSQLLPGFHRGWYSDQYWRIVGDGDDRSLCGGVMHASFKFHVRKSHDFGQPYKCAMVKLPRVGIVFCRGMDDTLNPELACVVFNADGSVRDAQAFRGQLGHWNDLVL